MTVIYSNFGDEDTKLLQAMWKGLDNVKVVELKPNSFREEMYDAILNEEDTILFCGHGSGNGCWSPSYHYSLDVNTLPYVKAKNIIGVWCHASDFARRYDVPGFFTYMFISSKAEANFEGIKSVSDKEIKRCELEFMQKVNQLLKDNVPLDRWVDKIQNEMLNENSNEVERFNYSQLYYNPNKPSQRDDEGYLKLQRAQADKYWWM